MTLQEIKSAVESGKVVHWKNSAYVVKLAKAGWLVKCELTGSSVGLTRMDGTTLAGTESDFYVAGAR